jgi:hypothetical protein
MYKKIILQSIAQVGSLLDWDDELNDDEQDDTYKYGAYLYTSLSILDDIKNYLLDLINDHLDKKIQIDENDIFLFLYEKKIFNDDYSELYDEINQYVSKADYGTYYFEGDEKKFEEIKKLLEELYYEFSIIDDSIEEEE